MTTYRIIATARATIEERWTVEADSPSDAYDKLLGGCGSLVLEGEQTLGDEEDRAIECMYSLDAKGKETVVAEGAWFDEPEDVEP